MCEERVGASLRMARRSTYGYTYTRCDRCGRREMLGMFLRMPPPHGPMSRLFYFCVLPLCPVSAFHIAHQTKLKLTEGNYIIIAGRLHVQSKEPHTGGEQEDCRQDQFPVCCYFAFYPSPASKLSAPVENVKISEKATSAAWEVSGV